MCCSKRWVGLDLKWSANAATWLVGVYGILTGIFVIRNGIVVITAHIIAKIGMNSIRALNSFNALVALCLRIKSRREANKDKTIKA